MFENSITSHRFSKLLVATLAILLVEALTSSRIAICSKSKDQHITIASLNMHDLRMWNTHSNKHAPDLNSFWIFQEPWRGDNLRQMVNDKVKKSDHCIFAFQEVSNFSTLRRFRDDAQSHHTELAELYYLMVGKKRRRDVHFGNAFASTLSFARRNLANSAELRQFDSSAYAANLNAPYFRDPIVATLPLYGLSVINVHAKAGPKSSDRVQKIQESELKLLAPHIAEMVLNEHPFVLIGDFNSDSRGNTPLAEFASTMTLVNLLDRLSENRWTYINEEKRYTAALDHIFVPRWLAKKIDSANGKAVIPFIDRSGMPPGRDTEYRFDNKKGITTPHAVVGVTFPVSALAP